MSKKHLTTSLEIKSLGEREFEGHGSVFGNTDLGGDVVMKGAFSRTLREKQQADDLIPMLWMHNPSQVVGKWHEISEDDTGLKMKGELADTQMGRELHTLLKMDAVRGMSIGYMTVKSDYDDDGVRLLKDLELFEVSLVSLPMNPLARIQHVKSRLSERGEYVPTPREFEQALRDVGCSQKVAKTIMSKIMHDEDGTRDVDPEARDVRSQADAETMKAAVAVANKLEALLISDAASKLFK